VLKAALGRRSRSATSTLVESPSADLGLGADITSVLIGYRGAGNFE